MYKHIGYKGYGAVLFMSICSKVESSRAGIGAGNPPDAPLDIYIPTPQTA